MTDGSPGRGQLEPQTIALVNKALADVRVGRLAEACALIEVSLRDGRDAAARSAFLGMLFVRSGNLPQGLQRLAAAHDARPFDVRIAANLAGALVDAGKPARALEVASASLVTLDPTPQLARIRGFVAQLLGKHDIAIEAYGHAVGLAPRDWESLNNLGNARIFAGDFAQGVADLERAITMAPNNGPLRLNLARAYRASGAFEKAERVLREMMLLFPGDEHPLADLYDLLNFSGREEEALEAIEAALKLKPNERDFLIAKARQLAILLRMEEAEEAFRALLQSSPGDADAYIGLATVYEHVRPHSLKELGGEASAQGAGAAAIGLINAYAARRDRDFEAGLEAIRSVGDEVEAANREHLHGQLLDGAGNYDAAFAAFTRMNLAQADDPSLPRLRGKVHRERIERQLNATSKAWFESWRVPLSDEPATSPVFLVGFPRSGTTLLDTFLMGHPDVVVLEERPAAAEAIKALGGFDAIASAGEDQVRSARAHYFNMVARFAKLGAGKLVIDKSPLLMNEVPALHRLFPGARFILALRHPADVLLSCLTSNFRLNDGMSSFLSLEDAAEFYDLSFRSWTNARALLGLNVHEVRYEELIENPHGVLQNLVEWLGLTWHEELLDHIATASKRGLVTTASYAQVTEPIYKSSIGRWRCYEKHLAAILPILAPWIEKMGYAI